MKSKSTSALCLAVLFALTSVAPAYAKGGSSGGGGGRSSFSGGGSFGRSSGGSSGGFFKAPSPPPPPPVKYSAPPPAPKPPPPPPPAPVKQALPPAPPPQPAKVAEKPAEKKFFQNEKGLQGADKRAIEAEKHAESKKAFEAAKAKKAEANRAVAEVIKPVSVPPPVRTESQAQVYDLARARQAREARERELAHQIALGRLRDREYRSRQVYGSYYNQPINVPSYYGGGYSDSYDNAYFWYWLMQSANRAERDRFIYDHERDIDPRRLAEIRNAFPDITASLDTFKAQNVTQNSSYVPPAFAGNEDLVYGDSVIKGATAKASETTSAKMLWVVLFLVLLGFSLYYLLFRVKWKVRETYV